MFSIRLSRAVARPPAESIARRAVAVIFLTSTLASAFPAQAWDPARINEPGSFEAIMSTKLPGVYGPRLPAPAVREQYPAPGSAEALARAKTPWLFPSKAVSPTPICANPASPGSFQAIMSVKDPAHYRAGCK